MKEIELIGKRKAREKHFLKQNGVIEAQVFDEDIHFLKNGIYEEIDNTLINKGDYYTNKNNAYKVTFAKTSKDDLTKISIGDNYIKTKLVNCNLSQLTENITESKLHKNVCYPDIIDNVDLEYNIMPAKVKEAIILKNKAVDLEKLEFSIETNLELELLDKKILAKSNDKVCFEFDAPYMIDADFKINNDIVYELSKLENNQYLLKLNINKEWLNSEDTKYPVMIDPTINNSGQNNSVYDTYIYLGDTGVDRNSQDMLKVGVERVNGVNRINRALLKFSLPLIGTGSQIIQAILNLEGYPQETHSLDCKTVTVHQITKDWNEIDANWNDMHDKYNTRIEGAIESRRGYYDYQKEVIVPVPNSCDLTNLVRKWYTGTPNYGILLKANVEQYDSNIFPIFYSKNNNIAGGNPKPILAVSYRNQNGVLEYMDYQTQSFSNGQAYVNNYNGNLTTIFNIGQTINGEMPVNLNLVYNTNDVVLNKNIGYGIGYKLNLHQTIQEQVIEGKTYLEYCDEDGTLHYFFNQKTTFGDNGYSTTDTGNVYYDEDGLNLKITKENNYYDLMDKNGSIMKFVKKENIAYLTEIKDDSGNKSIISYDQNNKIVKIVDPSGSEINISYENNVTTIISPDETVILNYSNNHLISINCLLGTTYFEYNENNIISKITDINGIKIVYEYYEQKPYKMKKVSEYGVDNTIGNYYNLIYGFDSTTIIDSKGKAKNIVFNSQGGIVSISSLKEKDDIKNAYGISETNGTSDFPLGYNNKLVKQEIPLKYVNNLLTNTSFEKNEIDFIGTNGISLSITDEVSKTGTNSLKAISTSDDQSFTQIVNVSKNNYYTFSAYVKNTNKLKLSLSYRDFDNILVEKLSEVIFPNSEFERYDVTIEYPENASSDLFVKIYMDEIGITYIDDIQLELGEVANNYNLLENSDFSRGFGDWNLSCSDFAEGETLPADRFEIVTLRDGSKALKTKMNPSYSSNMQKIFNIKGKAGDVFNISFWYKYEGIITYDYMDCGSRVGINFIYSEPDLGHGKVLSASFNPNDESWQYISNEFVAEWDYDSIVIDFYHFFDANNFYVTNLNLFKDIRNVHYEYDENGNVIMANDLNNKSNIFEYDKNNQLIQTLDPKGEKFMYEYDNSVTNRVINGISDTGVSNQIKYSNNKPIVTKVIKNYIFNDLVDGLYRIRLKGTNKYIKNISNQIEVKEEIFNHNLWKLEKTNEYFKIHHSILTDRYFTVRNGLLLLTNYDDDNSLFKLNKNKNGSYSIKLKSEDKYLKYNDQEIELATFIEGDYHFEFYFETNESNLFMESKATYTDDNKYISSIEDTLLNCKTYTIDSATGAIKSIKNPNGQITSYVYNDKHQIKSITNGEMSVIYNYNNQNCLSKIIHGRKEYNFVYDEFLNTKLIKIGDIILINNEYDSNNGEIICSNFGNNQKINYEYDEYGRLKQIIKMDDTVKYKYNNVGDLSKIILNDYEINHKYDTEKRLVNYKCNDFKINYTYDSNNNIICSKYKINNNVIEKVNNYNNSTLNKISFNNLEFNYTYDVLDRLKQMNINNNFNIKYEYFTNGNRTSSVIKSISNNEDYYTFKYNKMNNLTHIYHNNVLEYKYNYNKYNELIREYDKNQNKITTYSYDNLGNILSKKIYNINTLELIKKIKYDYQNNFWEDQLTKFDNNIITYDSIGNPLTIGENIELTWKNGRELSTYDDINLSVKYKYNHDGLRISKEINGIETKYYLEGNSIVFEIKGNDVLYFMRDLSNNLLGFIYNGEEYYYIKNINDDIIGILDKNYNIVARYEYDSWGNIKSIKNEIAQDISEVADHIANINPFRYRSYYYDRETGLYYLNSRYYNPSWGRFISPDNKLNSNQDILSYNMYIYCSNNPVNNKDEDGKAICNWLNKAVKSLANKVVKAISKVNKAVSDYWKKSLNKTRATQRKKKTTSSKKLKCQIKKTNPRTSNYPDYTSQLDRLLESNIKLMDDKGIGEAQVYFYKMVKDDKGPWDYKESEIWEKNLDIPFPKDGSKFIWRGYVIDAADFGNINYGYVGTHIRFPETILYMGGGYQEQGGFASEVFKGPYYGDRPEDVCAVKIGIDEYFK